MNKLYLSKIPFTTSRIMNQIVIMGRKTYFSLPKKQRSLKGITIIVISTTMKECDYPKIRIYPNLLTTLDALTVVPDRYNIFIIGGEMIYREAMTRKFIHLCDSIYITKMNDDYECDQFFPSWDKIDRSLLDTHLLYKRWNLSVKDRHQEYIYLDLLKKILDEGELRPNRTKIKTYSIFGTQMRFDIRDEIPFLTTKKFFWKKMLIELVWMIHGKTNSKKLEEKGVPFWKGNTSWTFLDQRGLTSYEVGDIGPNYGHQWRHWGAKYEGCNKKYEGYDQLQKVIDQIKDDPYSRRHIVSAWNVSDLDKMCLNPCHVMFQFNVSGGYLDCQLYQRLLFWAPS